MSNHNQKTLLDVFNQISKKENHQFKVQEMYVPKTSFEIETPQGFKKVTGMIIKEDQVITIKTDKGEVKVSKHHKILTDVQGKGVYKIAEYLSLGDLLRNGDSVAEIGGLSTEEVKKVYDITVDSPEHEWVDSQGFVHHNSHGIKQVLTNQFGASVDGPSGDWILKTGEKASTFGVYKTLLLNKHKVVVYDDSDSIWADKNTINLLKSATADDGERWISWGSGATANVDLMSTQARKDYEEEYMISVMEDPNTKMKPPSKFLFTGAFINISNLPTSAFAKGDLAAISSRSIFIDINLAQRDVLRRIATIMGYEGRDDKTIQTVLDVIAPPRGSDAIKGTGDYNPKVMGKIQYMTSEEARKFKTINMRTANIVLAMMDGDVKNFTRMAGLYS